MPPGMDEEGKASGGSGHARAMVVERARALGAAGDAIIATDADGSIIYWNGAAERLYGWAAEEVMGRNILEVTPSDLSREAAGEIMSRLLEGRSWSGDFEVRTKSGDTLKVDVSDVPVRSPLGELVAVIGVSRPAAR